MVCCQLSTVQPDHYGIDCVIKCMRACVFVFVDSTILQVLQFYIFTIPHVYIEHFSPFSIFSICLCIRFHRSRSTATANECGRRRDATFRIIDVIVSIVFEKLNNRIYRVEKKAAANIVQDSDWLRLRSHLFSSVIVIL